MLLGEGKCSVKMESERRGSTGVILAPEMTMVPSSRLLCRFSQKNCHYILSTLPPRNALACFPFATIAPQHYIDKS
jgi:hypothetical protein